MITKKDGDVIVIGLIWDEFKELEHGELRDLYTLYKDEGYYLMRTFIDKPVYVEHKLDKQVGTVLDIKQDKFGYFMAILRIENNSELAEKTIREIVNGERNGLSVCYIDGTDKKDWTKRTGTPRGSEISIVSEGAVPRSRIIAYCTNSNIYISESGINQVYDISFENISPYFSQFKTKKEMSQGGETTTTTNNGGDAKTGGNIDFSKMPEDEFKAVVNSIPVEALNTFLTKHLEDKRKKEEVVVASIKGLLDSEFMDKKLSKFIVDNPGEIKGEVSIGLIQAACSMYNKLKTLENVQEKGGASDPNTKKMKMDTQETTTTNTNTTNTTTTNTNTTTKPNPINDFGRILLQTISNTKNGNNEPNKPSSNITQEQMCALMSQARGG